MNYLVTAVITFLSLGVMVGLVVYLVLRTSALLGCRALWPAVVYGTLFVGGMVGMLLVASSKSDNFAGHLLVVGGSAVVGVLLVLVVSLALVDLVGLAVTIPQKVRIVAVATLTVVVAALSFANAARPVVKQVPIPVEGLAQPVRVVQLTDMHLGHNRGARHVDKIVSIVEAQNPDVVVITGDLFDSRYRLSPATIAPLHRLAVPVLFVVGNHDGYIGVEHVKRIVRSLGNVRVLENEVVELAGLQFVGLDNMNADSLDVGPHTKPGAPNIASVLPTLPVDRTKPTVVLHHIPSGARYVAEAGADLYLSGHTHGGQFPPVTWLDELMFDYNKGLYRLGKMAIYVSTGTGTTGPQMRLGTRPEVAVLDLYCGSTSK
ncbi:MAG: metallophosphoesterase [Bacteroidales bacterium]|nr:metallophosphoesterase [Bacteroidales bacterium]